MKRSRPPRRRRRAPRRRGGGALAALARRVESRLRRDEERIQPYPGFLRDSAGADGRCMSAADLARDRNLGTCRCGKPAEFAVWLDGERSSLCRPCLIGTDE